MLVSNFGASLLWYISLMENDAKKLGCWGNGISSWRLWKSKWCTHFWLGINYTNRSVGLIFRMSVICKRSQRSIFPLNSSNGLIWIRVWGQEREISNISKPKTGEKRNGEGWWDSCTVCHHEVFIHFHKPSESVCERVNLWTRAFRAGLASVCGAPAVNARGRFSAVASDTSLTHKSFAWVNFHSRTFTLMDFFFPNNYYLKFYFFPPHQEQNL